MGPDITFERRMIDVATMFLVSALSMLLVIYVGFGVWRMHIVFCIPSV